MSSLHILAISLLTDTWLANVFYHSTDCLFTSLIIRGKKIEKHRTKVTIVRKVTCWWECGEEDSCAQLVGMQIGAATGRHHGESSKKKKKIRILYNSAILFLDIYPKEMKMEYWDTWTPMFIWSWCLLAQYSYQGFSEKEMKPETSQVAWLC